MLRPAVARSVNCCNIPDLSWQVRLHNGVVEYNSLNLPQLELSRRRLTGLDGGDFSLGRAEGHAPLAVDGGDLADPQWQWPRSPLVVDGGVFS